MSVFRVEKNKNYTIISNYHLRDKRLSLKTIGLLSIILSLPENWDYTQAGLAAICKDGVDSVRSALKELEKYGYLIRERVRDEQGRMSGNIYHVFEEPNEHKMSEKPILEKPILVKAKEEIATLGVPKLDKGTQLITEKTIIENINNQTINQTINERSKIDNAIKTNIGYDCFLHRFNTAVKQFDDGLIDVDEYDFAINTCDINLIDKIVEYMVDVISSPQQDYIKIGENLIDRKSIVDKLYRIGYVEIKNTVFAIKTNTVKNKKKYALSMLYNS